ncbi:MAG: tRNA pseudouridine(38-40) synthase TruA [Lachnospiraceae bacterium]|nr:tRNA pseudouridine(38-40) synthase TruA [Lachnospiraceae bacterium]
MKIKLTIAYDGTNYCGWQVQPNGTSIQELIDLELSKLFKGKIKTVGASRTDAGVHAKGNVATFEVMTMMPPEKIAYALNAGLPADIVVQASEEVPERFHPRFSESIKTYEYHILNRTFPDPMRRHYTCFYYHPLDVEAMNEAAGYLVGEHDFTSFSSIHAQTNSYVREVLSCAVEKADDEVVLRISGRGFLYNMVRIIAGTLIEVGGGMRKADDIIRILEARDRGEAGPTAPPEGLVLMGIEYLPDYV